MVRSLQYVYPPLWLNLHVVILQEVEEAIILGVEDELGQRGELGEDIPEEKDVEMHCYKTFFISSCGRDFNFANLAEAASLPPASLVPNCPMGIRRLMLFDPT